MGVLRPAEAEFSGFGASGFGAWGLFLVSITAVMARTRNLSGFCNKGLQGALTIKAGWWGVWYSENKKEP